MAKPDERIVNYQQEREAAMKVQETLEQLGLGKIEDLGSGRADLGLYAEHMGDIGPENPTGGFVEKVVRDAQWAEQAGTQTQQSVEAPAAQESASSPEPDELASTKAAAESAKQEAAEWKDKWGRQSYQVGELRKRLQELEHRGQAQPQASQWSSYQQPQVMPPMRDPEAPITYADAMNLLMAHSAAVGNQLQQTYVSAIEAARRLGNYTLTPSEEADLQENHPWLLDLQPGKREQAMMELVKKPTEPAKQLTPTGMTQAELARARIRTVGTYIEPSSRMTAAEVAATTPTASVISKKIEALREALDKEGGSEEAEKIIASLTSGARRA